MSIPENMKEITDLASQLVKEELSAIGSSQDLTAMQGWQCPICKRVYSPFTHMCTYCGNREVKTEVLPNTKENSK